MNALAQVSPADGFVAGMPLSRTELFRERLAGRDVLPSGKAAAFARLDATALERARHNTRQVAQRIRVEIRYGRARGLGMAAILTRLDPQLFSPDHDWRGIFAGLARHGRVAEDCRRLAVAHYLAYLDARSACLDRLLADRPVPPG